MDPQIFGGLETLYPPKDCTLMLQKVMKLRRVIRSVEICVDSNIPIASPAVAILNPGWFGEKLSAVIDSGHFVRAKKIEPMRDGNNNSEIPIAVHLCLGDECDRKSTEHQQRNCRSKPHPTSPSPEPLSPYSLAPSPCFTVSAPSAAQSPASACHLFPPRPTCRGNSVSAPDVLSATR